ncbi:DUF1972 domain-containing protein [Salinivibrio sp. VYel1]|uniref:DUF1972 domain-containing protein n=1 Tax=Salinivibrio sp. VYel1 TaxID=2490490 RepID=UPI00128C7F53|nr:DUF1972 domain-containing protein [Salinivibrio sp. VYel1]MPX92118.1 glycosyltransferase family 1 protein [Salinivibrio sp. VYel1]
MKSVSIVGTVGIPACYGGFESLAENLTLNVKENIEYTVYCSSRSYKEKPSTHNNTNLKYIPLKANGLQSIPYDIWSLMSCCVNRPNVVVILGVSGCIFLPLFRIISKSHVVTNIDGLEWKRDKWGKWTRRYLKFSESLAVKYSDVIVTDNQAITDYVQEEYGVNSKTIAYGGDHAIRDIKVKKPDEKYALGLCRIEPENNVNMILEAFAQSSEKLKFVGNWNASEFGRNLKKEYSIFENIDLIDPIYDLDELFKLRSCCSLYLHGHSAGGTNPSLVEMMHFGVPIFCFDCSFNRYSTEEKADYFSNSDDLLAMLNRHEDDTLLQNALDMKRIAQRRYTWKEVAYLYENIYQ